MLINDKQVFVGHFLRKQERECLSVEALNAKKFDDKEWYVGKAQKKSEREHELKGRFEQTIKETNDYRGSGFVAFSTSEEASRALAEMNVAIGPSMAPRSMLMYLLVPQVLGSNFYMAKHPQQ
ncbi:hypothetical protein UlMin_026210 [Ulmus minor]